MIVATAMHGTDSRLTRRLFREIHVTQKKCE
jgi:hypothetical protein